VIVVIEGHREAVKYFTAKNWKICGPIAAENAKYMENSRWQL